VDEYLTMRELAERLKLRPQTIRLWVQKNEIPHYRIRKNVRFRPDEIEKWIKSGGAAKPKTGTESQGAELFAGENLTENETAQEGAGK